MQTFASFIKESDEFVLAWNALTAGKGKEARPIPITFKRFSKISSKRVPAGIRGHCFANALNNYRNLGLTMVVGFAVPADEVQQLLKTGKMSSNNLYRGYDHAWNLDKDGAVVDSTYRNEATTFRYYGKVVPDVTAASFRNDGDVNDYVSELNSQFDAADSRNKSLEKYYLDQKQKPITIQIGPPKYDERLKELGYEFNEAKHMHDGTIYYMYINKKNSGKLEFYWNPKTNQTSEVSLITRKKFGENPMRTWRTLEDWFQSR